MNNYDVMSVADKARKTGDDLAYYEQKQLELFQRMINALIDEMVAAQIEVKANATANE